MKAIELFNAHIEKKAIENLEVSSVINKKIPGLNRRQIYTLKYLLSGDNAITSKNSYSIMHSVAPKTAFRDLKSLQSLGLVESSQFGKVVIYRATEKTKKLLK